MFVALILDRRIDEVYQFKGLTMDRQFRFYFFSICERWVLLPSAFLFSLFLALGPCSVNAQDNSAAGRYPSIGVVVSQITDEHRSKYKLPDNFQGVIVTEITDSASAKDDIFIGDVVLEVGGEKIIEPAHVPDSLQKIYATGQSAALFYILRGGERRFVATKFSQVAVKGAQKESPPWWVLEGDWIATEEDHGGAGLLLVGGRGPKFTCDHISFKLIVVSEFSHEPDENEYNKFMFEFSDVSLGFTRALSSRRTLSGSREGTVKGVTSSEEEQLYAYSFDMTYDERDFFNEMIQSGAVIFYGTGRSRRETRVSRETYQISVSEGLREEWSSFYNHCLALGGGRPF